jgi:methylmalonyl-CoA mutase C-terminal domain/subunit
MLARSSFPGAKIIAHALRDASMEVTTRACTRRPSRSSRPCCRRMPDAVGLPILSGAHMTLVPKVIELLRARDADDVVVTVDGTIPAQDIEELKRLGVAELFTPGAPTHAIIDFLRGATASP